MLVVGVAGASGSGKSTIAAALAERLGGVVCPEDPRFFLLECPSSYRLRDPASEEPSSVDWPATLAEIRRVIGTGPRAVVVEHFLLLANADLVDLCDVIVYASVGTDRAARSLCRERRVARSRRTATEEAALRRYYDAAVWPAFLRNTHAPFLRLLDADASRAVVVDAARPIDRVVDDAHRAVSSSSSSCASAALQEAAARISSDPGTP